VSTPVRSPSSTRGALAQCLGEGCSLCVAPPHHAGSDLLRAHRRHPPQLTQPRGERDSSGQSRRMLYRCDVHAVSLVLTWPLRSRWVAPPWPCRRSHYGSSAEGSHVGALEIAAGSARSRGHSLSGDVVSTALHGRSARIRCRPGQVRGGERTGASSPRACFHW
jgi:hypothetical protein